MTDEAGQLIRMDWDGGPKVTYDRLVTGEVVPCAMTRRYVHNVGADVPLLAYQGANLSLPYYLHANHQGSIVLVTDPWGAPAINRYDEHGAPAATNTGRFQYTGQIWLEALGLYHYKARAYSPTLGRFMQTDPIGYQSGINVYAYALNDPGNTTDPSGLYPYTRQFLSDTWITTNIDDNLGENDQLTAERMVGQAARVTFGMESAGTLTADSAQSIRAIGTMSVSTRIAGYEWHQSGGPGNFNMNIGELQTTAQRQLNYQWGAAVVVAGEIIHDGGHAHQFQFGVMPQHLFTSDPINGGTAGQLNLFNSMVVGSERSAIAIQTGFLNQVAPTYLPSAVRDSMIRHINGQTDAGLLDRYRNRR